MSHGPNAQSNGGFNLKRTPDSMRVGKFMLAETVVPAPNGVWLVRSIKSGVVLGGIEWYAPWRQYVFQPERDTEYSPDCLRALAAFMERTP